MNRKRKESKARAAISALRSDAEFVTRVKAKGSTIRALEAFVREHVIEASDVDAAILKKEVTAARDAILIS